VAYPLLVFGATAAGLKITPANAAYKAAELAHQYKDSGASHIFAHPSLVPVVTEMLGGLGMDSQDARNLIWELTLDQNPTSSRLGSLADLIKGGKLDCEERFDGKASHETTFMCYSSGTTGLSKGVEVCGSFTSFVCSSCMLTWLSWCRQHITMRHQP
jgi:4-coumarate--CoA ligase